MGRCNVLQVKQEGQQPGAWNSGRGVSATAIPSASGTIEEMEDLLEQRGGSLHHGFGAALRVAGNRGMGKLFFWLPFQCMSVPNAAVAVAQVLQLACQDDQCGFFDVGEADGSRLSTFGSSSIVGQDLLVRSEPTGTSAERPRDPHVSPPLRLLRLPFLL